MPPWLLDCLCLLLLALGLHLLLLPSLCCNLPFSFYYQQPKHQTPESSLQKKAEQELASARKSEVRGRRQLGVLIMTARREEGGYLARCLVSLLAELSEEEVVVCTGETLGEHQELEHLLQPFPVLRPLRNLSLPFPASREQKAKHDFALCFSLLEKRLPPETEYVLVLEDDVILMKNFLSTLTGWMMFHQEVLAALPWLDIKLYLNPRLRGFAWDTQPLTDLLSSSLLSAFIFELLLHQWRRTSYPRAALSWLLSLLLLLALSRPHLTQWRRLHPQLYLLRPAPNPGLPAVLYKRDRLQAATQHLLANLGKDEPVDLALSAYRRKAGLVGLLLEPNLVRHIGRRSSMGRSHEGERDRGDMREFLAEYPI